MFTRINTFKRLRGRRLNRNAPKAKTHKPKKGKGAYSRIKSAIRAAIRVLNKPF